jgi:hypothetical protein
MYDEAINVWTTNISQKIFLLYFKYFKGSCYD